MSARLVEATPSDRCFDFRLRPYPPRTSLEGKLRSETFLWRALDAAGLSGSGLEETLHAVQRLCGRDRTVFAVKREGAVGGGELSFELYFPRGDSASLAPSTLADALGLALAVDVPADARYFLWSFELRPSEATVATVDRVSLYFAARQAATERCYALTAEGRELRNVYRFFHPKRDIVELVQSIRGSDHVDLDATPLSRILVPELLACPGVRLATKPACDALYYNQIDVDQLRWFLERHGYPAPIVELVTEHRDRLDHLRYDVGVDYRTGADGSLSIPKTAFYGTF